MTRKVKKTKSSRKAMRPPKKNKEVWNLQLFVDGHNSKSVTAFSNLKIVCEGQLKGKYHIKVIDLHKHPKFAREEQIIALPTVVRKAPLPKRNIIGDLSNTEHLLIGLGLMNDRVIQQI